MSQVPEGEESKRQEVDRVNCIDIGRRIAEYCSCELSIRQLEDFYLHLAQCQDCALYVQGYRKTVEILKDERHKQ